MDSRSIGAYGLILVIVFIIVAAVGWTKYHGAAKKGRRRLRKESSDYARDKAATSPQTPPAEKTTDSR